MSRDSGVPSDDRNPLHLGLSDEQAIKGIAHRAATDVYIRQRPQCGGVSRENCEQAKPLHKELIDPFIWDLELAE